MSGTPKISWHGHNKSTGRSGTYLTWDTMNQRCRNPKNTNYPNYAGITVCDRWRKFENFLADMGERPKKFTLERVDNSRGYEPGNCKWATRQEQLNNKRTNVFIEHDGKRMTLTRWAQFLGINLYTLRYRYMVSKKWPPR